MDIQAYDLAGNPSEYRYIFIYKEDNDLLYLPFISLK